MIYNVGDETHIDLPDGSLKEIERLIRSAPTVSPELDNFANTIRAHLQHKPGPIVEAGPVETLLLEQAGSHCGRAEAELFLKAAIMVAGREPGQAVSTDEDASWLG